MSANAIRVALRADASPLIGLGHVKRCLALAHALGEVGAQVRIVTRDLGVDVSSMVRDGGFDLVALQAPTATKAPNDRVTRAGWAGVAWRDDANQVASALTSWRPDWVIVDHYSFDARWHREIAAQLGARIAVVDDLADRDLSADMLIDHNLSDDHQEKYRGRVADGTVLLCGPRFALLGPAFAQVQPLSVNDSVRSIGIFMGGVDSSDLSSLALRACREHAGYVERIEVVTTRSNPHLQSLKTLATRWAGTEVVADLPDLASFFGRHDLQIGAGGGATWERCRLGAPTLALVAADNQQAVIPGLARLGAVAVLESSLAPTVATVGHAVKKLLKEPLRRRELGERSSALVDGLGARRVACRIAADTLTVRPAVAQDAEMMYRWRNHPSTRGVSNDARPIAWVDHMAWLARTLADPVHCMLVGSVGALAVGVIRFDMSGDSQAVVSLYLDPALHGLKLGHALLLASESHAIARSPNLHFVARVLESNESSRRMFESCGYRVQDGLWHKESTSKPQSEMS